MREVTMEKVLESLQEKCELVHVENEEQWHEERKKSIGGSEIGAILGYNNYKSPYAVYAEKLGLSEGFEGNIATEVGNVLEPYIRKKFPDLVKLKDQIEVKVYELPYILKSKEWSMAKLAEINSYSTYACYETGDREPNLETMGRIAKVLGEKDLVKLFRKGGVVIAEKSNQN